MSHCLSSPSPYRHASRQARIILAAALAVFWPMLLLAAPVGQAIDLETDLVKREQESQTRINTMDDEIARLAAEYENLRHELDTLTVYNANLDDMIRSQQNEAHTLERQIEELKITQREIVPLMTEMLDTLEQFVLADLPFLSAERLARIAGLRSLMGRADVGTPEKFQQIMHAYQAESDYGRTIEAYQGELDSSTDGQARSVEFLRLGRLNLLYQTLDRQESGYWDPRDKVWVRLNSAHNHAVRQGLRVAARQAAPELILAPVAGPVSIPTATAITEEQP